MTKAIPTIFINKLFSLNCFPPIKSQGSKQIRKSLEGILWYCISKYKLVMIILYLLRHFLVSDLLDLIQFICFVGLKDIFDILKHFVLFLLFDDLWLNNLLADVTFPLWPEIVIVIVMSSIVHTPHSTLTASHWTQQSNDKKKFDKLWHQRVGLPPSC